MAELKVTAHVMTLERGLFCVFPAQGSPTPDAASGLPGVRITRTPSRDQDPDSVRITTFRDDGWLENTAALVHVQQTSAQVLVSSYQAGNAPPNMAPLSQPVASMEPAQRPSATDTDPAIVAHIQRTGDVGGALGQRLGTKGSQAWIEGFGLAPRGEVRASDVEYQGVLGRGWLSPWVEGGKFCGSRGMALPLLGIKIRLKGEAAEKFDCQYSASFVDGSEVGPVPMGEACQSESLAALESSEVSILSRSAAPRRRAPPVADQ